MGFSQCGLVSLPFTKYQRQLSRTKLYQSCHAKRVLARHRNSLQLRISYLPSATSTKLSKNALRAGLVKRISC